MVLNQLPFFRKNYPLFVSFGFGVVMLVFFVPIIFISFFRIVNRGEQQFAELEVSRVNTLVNSDVAQMSRSLGDWANWDDTYNFALGLHPEFIQNNLMDETFHTLDVNSILLLDTDGHILYQNTVSLQDQQNEQVEVDYGALLSSYPQLADSSNLAPLSGLIVFQDRILAVASQPILTSFLEGPPAGRILFVRFLDEYRVENYSILAYRKLEIFPLQSVIDGVRLEKGFSPSKAGLTVYKVNQHTCFGYHSMADISGNESIVLKVEIPRYLNIQAQSTAWIMGAAITAMTIIISLIAYFYSKSVQLSRKRQIEQETASRLLEKTRQDAIELEKKVWERTRQLELKNRDLETFNYSVSHDLKSPLRGISGYASVLLSEYADSLDAKGKKYLQGLVESSGRMNRLIEDLLSYTKTDRQDIQPAFVEVEKLVNLLLAEYTDVINTRGIVIQKEYACSSMLVDVNGISLVLRNLLDNAVKFSQSADHPTIKIASIKDEGKIILSITDNGIGFDMQFHDKIFDLFQQLHLPEEYPGTGIGLALVKKTMEKMGGRVYAQSAPGEGSTFFVEIPQ